jgi:hypothetical protein
MKQTTETKMYEKEGQMGGAVGAVIQLITGVGVAVLVLIFVGALGGQTYNLVESDIDAISNGTVQSSVKNGIISGFSALEQTGNYLPIIVLAVVIALVLFLVLGMTNVGQGGGRGSAL